MSIAVPWAPRPSNAVARDTPRTDVVIKRVSDPVIRDTLIAFEANLSPVAAPRAGSLPGRTSWPLDAVVMALSHGLDPGARGTGSSWVVGVARAASPAIADALLAIDEIQQALGISQQDTLRAAGIKKRTYHSWKKGRIARIRPDSLGCLWELHDLVSDLLEIKGRTGVKHWLAEDAHRIEALVRGDFDCLMEAASRTGRRDDGFSTWPAVLQVEEPLHMTVRSMQGISMDADDIVEP